MHERSERPDSAMREVVPSVYVFSGTIAGRVHLIDDDGGYTLIDAGLPNAPPKVVEQMHAADMRVERIRRIVVTHAHPDHIGGLAALRAMTGAEVVASAPERAVIEGRSPTPLPNRGDVPVMSRFLVPPPVAMHTAGVDRVVGDGDVIWGRMGGLTVVATPGHSPGHISLWQAERRILFAGDTITNLRGRLRLPYAFLTVDMSENLRSIARLAALQPRAVLFGHGEPLLHDAAGQLRRFAADVEVKQR